jgi:transcriptional regulator with XRE-family HTH domain
VLNLNERIALIRKNEVLSRASFGKRLGVSGDVINNLERGRVEIKKHMILLICKEFNVNEDWLRTGNGEMYLPMDRESEIAKLTVQLLAEESDSFRNRLISALSRLTEEQWELLAEIADNITKKE